MPGEPKGEMRDGAYFAAGSDESARSKAVVLLTDIFGLPLVNCKIMADQFAEIRARITVRDARALSVIAIVSACLTRSEKRLECFS